MTTQAQASSQHLAAAQELLDELGAVTTRDDADSQTKATTAVAQSILVLAEQVATIRVLMVEEALLRRANGQPALADGQPAPANGQPALADGQRAPADGQPAPADGQPALANGQMPPANDEPSPVDGQMAAAEGQPSPAGGQAAPQDNEIPKKRRWW